MAGRFGREYVPGRSWKGFAEALLLSCRPWSSPTSAPAKDLFLCCLPSVQSASSPSTTRKKWWSSALQLARKQGVKNLEYRLGDLEEIPIDTASVDVALLSQSLHHAMHPERAIAEAWRILKPGGRIAILDLGKHRFEEARELYADLWLGFSEVELESLIHKAGFQNVLTSIVHKEAEAPHFQTLLAVGDKPNLSK